MYEVFEAKNGRKVGMISPTGQVCCFEPDDQRKLAAFLQREFLVRESEQDEEVVEPVLEETMCFLGMYTLRPGDPAHLQVALEQLHILTNYIAKEVE